MFHLFSGPFRALEEAFVTDLETTRKKDPLSSLLILSPSGRLLTHLQTKLAETKTGFLNAHFLTFYALAERLLAASEYTEQTVTEPALYQEIIRQILTGDHPEPVDLAIRQALNSEGKPIPRGLAGALAATMKDLRDAGMRADKAIQATQEGYLGKEAPEAASTLALYARLIGLFEKKHLRSSADLLRRAAKEAPTHPWLRQQKAIFLYGFYDLTGVQLDLVLSLANHPNARVYFPYEKGNQAYAFAEKLLQDSAFVSKCAPPTTMGMGTVPTAQPIAPWGQSPISPISNVEFRGDCPQTVWSCSGARDEIWLVAKEILRLREKGVPFQDIAVIARRLDPYLSSLNDLFATHRIPFYTPHASPANLYPLTKIIRSLLTWDEKNPLVETIRQDLAKSPYLASTPSTLEQNDDKLPWSTHVDWAVQRMEKHLRLPPDATETERGLYAAALESLSALRLLDSLNIKVTGVHFLKTWEEKMDALEIPAAPANAGVQVLDVLQARGLSFRAVFLLGLNEKSFPRLIREDPFLSDAARGALAQATGCRLARKLDGYNEERMLFELMRASATEHLTLITQRSDEEGKTLIPSIYLQEYLRHTNGKPHRLPRAFPFKFRAIKLPPMDTAPKEVSYLMNRAESPPEELESLYGALGWEKDRFKTLMASQMELERFNKGILPRDGLIVTPELLKPALEAGFSPSSLEDLAECPYQYYAGHVLRLKVEDDPAPEGELTNKALGNIFHRILEVFYESLRGKRMPSLAELASPLETACQKVFEEFAASHPPIYPIAWKAAQTMVRATLNTFLQEDIKECSENGFIPTYFEESFESDLPDLAGPTSLVRFHGRPDRIDVGDGPEGKRVRIVDYKTGKARALSGKIETQLIKGRFLQLPIYMGLASHLGKVESASLRWVRPENEDAEPPSLAAGFWNTPDAKTLSENVQGLLEIARSGHFYIEPDGGDWGYCAKCAFARLCRKEHMRTRARSEWDPVRQANQKRFGRVSDSGRKKGKKPVA